jgi:hypothetical protein
MTLITRLSTSFTDATLPQLVKDPAIVDGTRLLVDMKSPGTWPSQDSSITTSDQLFSLVDNSWPILGVRGTHTYNPTRGGLQANAQGDASSGLWLSDASTGIFDDATHAWAFTFWLYRGAATSGSFSLLEDHAVTVTSAGTGGPVTLKIVGANGSNNANYLLGSNYNVLRRIGFAVYQDASNQWKYRTVTDNSVANESDLSGATNTAGGAGLRASASGTTRPRVFTVPAGGFGVVPTDYLFYRTFVEDLTLSGRSYQQAFDADWARGNGRFS